MSDRRYLVLSAIGPDRPGLVAGLTASIARRGGNVEDSRMAVLGGSFGVMLLLSGEPAVIERITAEAGQLEADSGLKIHIETTVAPHVAGGSARYTIEVEAADREGIVHAIAAALYDLGGNIVSLQSEVYPAPVTGAPLFRLTLAVDIPGQVAPATLQAALDQLAVGENLDCTVRR